MKTGKKLSVILSLLLVLNVFFSVGNIKVKAEGTSDAIKISSVSVNTKLVDIKMPVELTVEATSTDASLSTNAYAVYVQRTGQGDLEKELTLSLGNDKKYHAAITAATSADYGNYMLSFVTVQDNGGNVAIAYNSKLHDNVGQDLSAADFTVSEDKTGPSLGNITLDKSAAKLGVNVTINVAATDDMSGLAPAANLAYVLKTQAGDVEKEVTLNLVDGKYTGVLSINKADFQEGLWQLSYIILSDNRGNVTPVYNNKVHENVGQDLSSANLLLDFTAPVKPAISVSTDKITNQNVKVTITGEDGTIIEYRLKGQQNWTVYKGTFDVTENTSVEARATDVAGNVSESSKIDIANIDKIAPEITITGVNDNGDYINLSVTPKISVDDAAATVTTTLDGKEYKSGDVIWAVGNHVLKVTAVDLAGNKTEKVINFKIEAAILSGNDQTGLIDEINNLVKNTKPGDTIVISATTNPVISTELFKALQGLDRVVSFTLESQGVSLTWTINGKDIVNVTSSVDLGLNAVAPHKDIINKIDSNAVIFSFKNHGTLPNPMKVTLPVDPAKFDVSKPLYLYYYNETTKKAELVGGSLVAYKVGDKYYVDVTITHNSDFFLSALDNTTISNKVDKLAKTGSPIDMNVLVGLGALLIVMGSAIFVFGIRRRRFQQ